MKSSCSQGHIVTAELLQKRENSYRRSVWCNFLISLQEEEDIVLMIL